MQKKYLDCDGFDAIGKLLGNDVSQSLSLSISVVGEEILDCTVCYYLAEL